MQSAKNVGEDPNVCVGALASALFEEIRAGGDEITTRLRHVTDEEKLYKQNVQHGAVDFSALDKLRTEAEAKRRQHDKTASEVHSTRPVLQLQGDKLWVVRHHSGTNLRPAAVTVENAQMRHAVQIENCEYATIEIKGKVNSVSVLSCSNVQVVLERIVSSLDILRSENVEVKVLFAAPTISIERSLSVNVYLMDRNEALNTEVITACSATVNISVPSEEDAGTIVERPVPEQFVSKIVRDTKSGYKIVTKPTNII